LETPPKVTRRALSAREEKDFMDLTSITLE